MFLIKICAATCFFPVNFTTLIIALTGGAFSLEISIFAHLFQVYAIRAYIAVIHFV